MRNKKKGFTIVELVVVIVVIAILAAVIIPTYNGIIMKANRNIDAQLVVLLNSNLKVDLADNDKLKHNTMYDAIKVCEDRGVAPDKIAAKSDYNIAWDSNTGEFVLADVSANLVYYAQDDGSVKQSSVEGSEVDYFIITSYDERIEKDSNFKYSIYAYGNNWPSELTIHSGFDAGEVKGIKKVTYNNKTDAQSVIIRTNAFETVLVIDGNENLDVRHYGYAGLVDVVKVGKNSYKEYGVVGRITLDYGHVNIKAEAIVYQIEAAKGINATVSRDYTTTIYNANGEKVDEAFAKSTTVFSNQTDKLSACDCDHSAGTSLVIDGNDVYQVCLKCGYTVVKINNQLKTVAKSNDPDAENMIVPKKVYNELKKSNSDNGSVYIEEDNKVLSSSTILSEKISSKCSHTSISCVSNNDGTHVEKCNLCGLQLLENCSKCIEETCCCGYFMGDIPGFYNSDGNLLFKLTLENCGADCSLLKNNVVIADNQFFSSPGVCSNSYCYRFYYQTIDSSHEITKVLLPEGVTSINSSVFKKCISVKTLILPETLTVINDYAFEYYYGVESIELTDNVTEIGVRAFSNCWALSKITIPSSVKKMKEYAFACSYGLTEVEFLGTPECADDIFYATYQLKKATLAEGTEKISDYMFELCKNLEEITIPSSVKSIGNCAFKNCYALKKVTFAEGSQLTSIGYSAFYYDKVLESINIPNTITSYGNYAFGYCGKLSTKLPLNNNTIIDAGAFTGTAIKDFDLGTNNTTYSCENGVLYKLTNGVKTSIVYYGDTESTSFTIPSTVTSIQNYAMNTISNLTINMPLNVPYIYEYAFYFGNNLKVVYNDTSINFVTAVKATGVTLWTEWVTTFVFTNEELSGEDTYMKVIHEHSYIYSSNNDGTHTYECSYCSDISIKENCDKLGTNCACSKCNYFDGERPGFYNSTGNLLFELTLQNCGADCSLLKNNCVIATNQYISFPGIVATDYGRRYYYEKQTSSCEITKIILPEGVTSINKDTFYYCVNGINLILPSTLTVINEYAFEDFLGLKSIVLTDKVTEIQYRAFASCWKLTKITIPASVKKIGSYCFASSYGLTEVEILGTPEFYSYVFYNVDQLKKITLTEGITKISDYMFQLCDHLEEITIPASVKSIENSAFYGCSALKKVTFAEGSKLTSIGNNAFYSDKALESINVPNTITSYGNYAFRLCDKLSSIMPLFSSTSLGTETFVGTAITSFKLGTNNTMYANENGALYSLTQGVKTTLIHYGGRSSTSFTIPNTVTTIQNYAFYGFSNFTINLPSNVPYINSYAFYNGTNLKAVYNDTSINFVTSIKAAGFTSWVKYISTFVFTNEELTGNDTYKKITHTHSYVYTSNEDGTHNAKCSTCNDPAIIESCDRKGTGGICSKCGYFAGEPAGFYNSSNDLLLALTLENCGSDCSLLKNIYSKQYITTSSDGSTSGYYFYYGSKDNAHAIKKVILPEGIETMGIETFYNCISLEEITIPSSVKLIDDRALSACYNLKTVTFAEGSKLEKLEKNSFNLCKKLETINIPDTVTYYGGYSLAGCLNLTITININKDCVVVNSAFSKTPISGFTVDSANTNVAYENDVLYELQNGVKKTIIFYANKTLSEFTIPSTVNCLATGAFYNCSNLIIVFPNSYVDVNYETFKLGNNNITIKYNGTCSSFISVNNLCVNDWLYRITLFDFTDQDMTGAQVWSASDGPM